MKYSLTWLPDVLKAAGLKVALVDGWESRGHGDMGPIEGVICHHTAGGRVGNMPSLKVVRDGRPDLPGPLAQLGLGRDGTYYIIAAGRCNHAGPGAWMGLTKGNTSFIGIEAENTGLQNDFPWPDIQVDAYQRGVAAILKHIGKTAACCAAHREWALPKGRKTDPTLNMDAFRALVAAHINGDGPPLQLIPAVEPVAPPGGPPRSTLRRGALASPLVAELQKKLNIAPPGPFGPKTEAAVRTFQRAHGLVADGIVGPTTWAALDAVI